MQQQQLIQQQQMQAQCQAEEDDCNEERSVLQISSFIFVIGYVLVLPRPADRNRAQITNKSLFV